MTLRAEIQNDPLSRGYVGMTDQQVVDDLNTVYRPAPDRDQLSQAELYELIVQSERVALPADDKEEVSILLGIELIDVSSGSKARTNLMAIFNGTTTFTNIGNFVSNQLQTRTAELEVGEVNESRISGARI